MRPGRVLEHLLRYSALISPDTTPKERHISSGSDDSQNTTRPTAVLMRKSVCEVHLYAVNASTATAAMRIIFSIHFAFFIVAKLRGECC